MSDTFYPCWFVFCCCVGRYLFYIKRPRGLDLCLAHFATWYSCDEGGPTGALFKIRYYKQTVPRWRFFRRLKVMKVGCSVVKIGFDNSFRF